MNNNNNYNNSHENVYGAIILTNVIAREFTRFIWWIQTVRRVTTNPQTKAIDLSCESAEN